MSPPWCAFARSARCDRALEPPTSSSPATRACPPPRSPRRTPAPLSPLERDPCPSFPRSRSSAAVSPQRHRAPIAGVACCIRGLFVATWPGRQTSRCRSRPDVRRPRRRGKYLWLPLTDGDAMLAHLGMSGQFAWLCRRALAPNTRIRFAFTDGEPELRFIDQRMFGGLSLSPGGAELPPEIAHIGRDPFDPEFDLADAVARLRRRNTAIKRRCWISSWCQASATSTPMRRCGRPGCTTPARPSDVPGPGRGRDYGRGDVMAARWAMAAPPSTRSTSTSTDPVATSIARCRLRTRGRAVPALRNPDPAGAFMNRSSYRCPRCQRAPRRAEPRSKRALKRNGVLS